MIYLIGIFLALFLSLILVSKKDKTKADWILFAWLFTIAIHLTLYTLQANETTYSYPFLLGLALPLPLLHWPFLFLYVSSLTTKKGFDIKSWVHFIPFFLSFVLFSNYFFLPNVSKIEIYKNQGMGYETQLTINLISIILSAFIYTTFSIIRFYQYKKTIRNEFSYLEKINLNWLFYLIAGMTSLFLIIALGGSDKLLFTSVVGFVLFIGYFGIQQMGVFTQHSHSSENSHVYSIKDHKNCIEQAPSLNTIKEGALLSDSTIDPKEPKYQKSSLSVDAAQKIYEDLQTIMKTQKLYTNAVLTLDDLADTLNVLPNHLSQVINSIEHKNFFDYINQLRIDEFVSLLSKPESQKYTLLSLAFECGFNSKTSFNRNFKKVTGFAPSEYIKQKDLKTTH